MFTGIIQSIGKLKQEKNILEIEILDNLFDTIKLKKFYQPFSLSHSVEILFEDKS